MGLLDLIPLAFKIIDKVIPDPAAKAAAQLQVMQLQQAGEFKELDAQLQLAQGQLDINKIEAASPSFFKSGWRPYVGWTCAMALSIQFVVAPLATWVVTLITGKTIAFPSLDMGTLLTLLGTLLGTASLRTVEKLQGKS